MVGKPPGQASEGHGCLSWTSPWLGDREILLTKEARVLFPPIPEVEVMKARILLLLCLLSSSP